jgi:hypothetical protein
MLRTRQAKTPLTLRCLSCSFACRREGQKMEHDRASAKKIYMDRRCGGVEKKGGGGYRRQDKCAPDMDRDPSRSSASPVASRDFPSIKPVSSWHVLPPEPDDQPRAGRIRWPGPQAPQISGAAASQAAQACASSPAVDTGGALVSFLASAQIQPSHPSYTYLVILRRAITVRVADAFVRCGTPDMPAAVTPPALPFLPPPHSRWRAQSHVA